MAELTILEAEARERAGKGAARATRRQGKVPAVIYGTKMTPTLIALEPRQVVRELHRGGWRSRLYNVKLGGETIRALIRDVQFHPVTDQPEHVDFQHFAAGQTMRVAISVAFRNELTSVGLKRGGMLNVVRHAVECLVDPDNVPPHFEADLAALDIHDNVRWSNLKGTEGTRPVITDRDFVIATIAPPTKLPEVPTDAPSATAAAATPAAGAAAGAAGAKAPAAAPAAAPAKKK